MNYSAIDQAYSMLWNQFKDACKQGSAYVRAKDTIGFLCQRDESVPVVTHVTSLLYLRDWPVKSTTTRGKVVDILVKGAESYKLDEEIITQSIVKVQYFSIEKDVATPLIGVHYDFNGVAQPAHPIFHAQLAQLEDFAAGDLDSVGFRRKIGGREIKLLSTVKLPTPHMGLCSVLLGLTADHLPSKAFNLFLGGVRKNKSINWNAPCAHLREGIKKSGGYPHSHYWYEPCTTTAG